MTVPSSLGSSLVTIGTVLVCILSYKKKSLTAFGAVIAFCLTRGLYAFGGVVFLAPLFAFFLSLSFVTKLGALEKDKLEKALYERGGKRDHIQVLANGGAAFIIATIYYLMPGPQLIIAYFTAFAACNADSWASEIGVMSRKPPFSLIDFKPVQRGMSGGVTVLGLFASLCGAAFIAGLYFIFFITAIPLVQLLASCVFITAFGFAGSIIDSLLGATMQPAYINNSTGGLTEIRKINGIQNKKVKGFEIFSNDMVNFASSLIAAGLTAITLIFFIV